jgi:putative membrane protein
MTGRIRCSASKEAVMMQWGNFGWGMGFGWIFMVFFWVLVIFGVVYFIQSIMWKPGKSREKETPLDILKVRYARGEISKEEFERMKNDINKS